MKVNHQIYLIYHEGVHLIHDVSGLCVSVVIVFVRGKWKPTRIEYGDNWYLVGIRAADLSGLRVRI
mgnify:CR=1 FL=1